MPAGNLGQTGPLRLHPSLHLLHLDHPAVSIWQANQPDRDGRTDAVGAQIALIWRRPDFGVSVEPLSQMDGGFIAALMQGAPMAAAAVLTDPVPMLTLLLRDGELCRDAMRRARVTEPELMTVLRANGHSARPEEAAAIILESDGSFSVLGASETSRPGRKAAM